jgi:NAD(P)-binding Rossmann-like domain
VRYSKRITAAVVVYNDCLIDASSMALISLLFISSIVWLSFCQLAVQGFSLLFQKSSINQQFHPASPLQGSHRQSPSHLFSSSSDVPFFAQRSGQSDQPSDAPLSTTKPQQDEQFDVIVIGAGVGGLSCAAMCAAAYGYKTLVVEAHDQVAGGCAHSFKRYSSASKQAFIFDSGPSLISGLSSPSTNPLRQVLEAIKMEDAIEWVKYDGWMVHDKSRVGVAFKVTTGSGNEFEEAIEAFAGKDARNAFESFNKEILKPNGIAQASALIPPMALRGDWTSVWSLMPYWLKLLTIGPSGTQLTGPFSALLDKNGCKDPFVRQWYDYLAFALSGLDAAHTQAA